MDADQNTVYVNIILDTKRTSGSDSPLYLSPRLLSYEILAGIT